jgi:MFS superfamily sulfate permease-like transporter
LARHLSATWLHVRNIASQARWDRHELAGSLGDLGTFLPLLLGVAVHNGLDFASGLFFAGLFNLITGLMFAIPVAVQPMKAIAAVALTERLSREEILAAGASVSLFILLLGLTGLIDWFSRVIPKSVVRGLQLALGLSLLLKGVEMVAGSPHWLGPDSRATGLIAAVAVLLLFSSRWLPPALLLFAAGLTIAVGTQPDRLYALGLGVTLPHWTPLAWADFVSAFPKAALPQIPLTTLNSVIAVCALAADLFPQRRIEPRTLAISVGLMNLTACWFGGMPMCHGAGGLAGQYRFGARTNGATFFLGVAKLLLAVLFGASLLSLCQAFPTSILGVMLAAAGMELALVCRDQTRRGDAFVMLLTAAVAMAVNHTAVGVVCGLAVAWSMQAGWFQVDPTEQG